MDKKGFVKYYEEIKDATDLTNVLCKYVNIIIVNGFWTIFIWSVWSHVFAIFDRDHNGTIDFHEFLLAIAAGTPSDLDSHLDYVFEM